LIVVPGRLDAERREDLQPAIVVDGFGIGQNAVEVEENGIESQDIILS